MKVGVAGLGRMGSAIAKRLIEIGHEVTLIWGESGGGSGKTTVERHKQTKMRVVVSPAPYSEVVRTTYAEGWRSAQGWQTAQKA